MLRSTAVGVLAAMAAHSALAADPPAAEESVAAVFSPASEIALAMKVEAAIARAQAAHGVIPEAAAREISATASIEYAPLEDVAAANERLGHRMEALLAVWRPRLSEQARDGLHHGVTTVDVYDTVLSLQLLAASELLVARIDALDLRLAALAQTHRDTPMAGRTLGQYALPLTFGKKVAVSIGELGRHRERFCQTRARLARSIILKGPVGSYAGLGPKAPAVEASFARELGLPRPYPDDWHGARDVYAETALDIALLSRSLARIGQEIFLLQSGDIGEVRERLDDAAVSSSSMPQKVNPQLSEALIHYGRTLPRQAEVALDDVVNFYERDNTSRPNAALAALAIDADAMLVAAMSLIARLDVDAAAMRETVARAGAPMRSQAAMQALTPALGRDAATAAVKAALVLSRQTGQPLLDALHELPDVNGALSRDALAEALDPFADLGGAGAQVDAVLKAATESRAASCAKR